MKAQLLVAARAVRTPAILGALYAVAHLAFAALTERHGLVSPERVASPGLLVLGALLMFLRLALLFVVPAWIAYRVVARVVGGRSAPRAEAGTSPRDG